VPRRYQRDWDELARREPYFAVLTDRRFLGELDEEARRAFFESGAADARLLLTSIREKVDAAFDPKSALDFGCGVGRITLALANEVADVAGCDIAPEMIAIARQNAAAAARTNIEFTTHLSALSGRSFDLIASLIVFQHIPVREGLSTLSRLLGFLAPGGVAAIHFTLRRPGSALRRLFRRLRGSVPLLHRAALRWEGDELGLPYMQMNEYRERDIRRRVAGADAVIRHVMPRDEGGVEGAVFFVQRSPT
jgi:SAM-dependent methyltransferase